MSLERITVDIKADPEPFAEALRKAGEAIAKMAPTIRKLGRVFARQHERAAARRHQPIPLRIDGHEYRRRTRGRRR